MTAMSGKHGNLGQAQQFESPASYPHPKDVKPAASELRWTGLRLIRATRQVHHGVQSVLTIAGLYNTLSIQDALPARKPAKGALVMVRLITFLLVGLAFLPAAHAQPSGPYLQYCDQTSIGQARFAGKDREYLYAVCRDRSGRQVANAFYNFRRCRSQIQSVGGVLQCNGLPEVTLPRGPYLQTCESVIIAHGVAGAETLYARCRNARGRLLEQSALELADCDGAAVVNNNGVLGCSFASGPDPYAPPPGSGYGPGYGPPPGPGAGYGPGNGPPPPRGSYRTSCDQIYVTPGPGKTLTLNARCQTRRGRVVDAVLPNYQACRGDIGNNDGRLECSAAQGENLGQPPRGSYRATCRDDQLVRGRSGTIDLIASCQTRSGRLVDATLPNVRACNGDISNDDGRLVCQKGPDLGELPRGSYAGSCRDARLEQRPGGTVDLLASCKTRSGRFVDATLPNVRGCKGDIGNDNGQLVCAR